MECGGPLFADGIAARQSIIALPLAEGYSTTFRTFDLQQMKARTIELKVAGMEKVTVPARSRRCGSKRVRSTARPSQ